MKKETTLWLAVNADGIEKCSEYKPYRYSDEYWGHCAQILSLPNGTIKKLIGKELTWDDEPFEYKG